VTVIQSAIELVFRDTTRSDLRPKLRSPGCSVEFIDTVRRRPEGQFRQDVAASIDHVEPLMAWLDWQDHSTELSFVYLPRNGSI